MNSRKAILQTSLKNTSKYVLLLLGGFFVFFIILAFTDAPYYMHRRLGRIDYQLRSGPDFIIVLGGSGMPSPDGLMRCYQTALTAQKHQTAKIIITHPGMDNDSTSQAILMAKELLLRGIDSARISLELKGYNTYTQISSVSKHFLTDSSKVLLVTSPEHMLRAVKCLKKMGIDSVSGSAAFANSLSRSQLIENGRRNSEFTLFYDFWSYMNYELLVTREYLALTYYKLRGWI